MPNATSKAGFGMLWIETRLDNCKLGVTPKEMAKKWRLGYFGYFGYFGSMVSSRTFSRLWVVHTDLLQSFGASTALCQQTHHQHLSPDVVLRETGFNLISPVAWFDGFLWIMAMFYGFLWISMDFYGL